MQWNVDIGERPSINVGEMKIFRIEEVCQLSNATEELVFIVAANQTKPENFVCLVISKSENIGQIVLLYRLSNEPGVNESNPDIWFIDICNRVHYITDSFTAFFRILVSNLGIFGW